MLSLLLYIYLWKFPLFQQCELNFPGHLPSNLYYSGTWPTSTPIVLLLQSPLTMVLSAHAAPPTPAPPDISMADTVSFNPALPPCKSSLKSSKFSFETSVETGKPCLVHNSTVIQSLLPCLAQLTLRPLLLTPFTHPHLPLWSTTTKSAHLIPLLQMTPPPTCLPLLLDHCYTLTSTSHPPKCNNSTPLSP